MTELVEVANELYALTPGEFTAARNERSKDAKAAGDRDLTNQIKALSKPSVAAWVVNMMVRRMADEIDQVLTLGASLRRAQADLDGDELRQLNKQRRQLTTAVTSQGRALAAQLGQKVSESGATQVESTLHAAMTDEDAEAAVRTGLLVETLQATGLGPVDLAGVVAVPSALGERAPRVEAPEPEKPKLTVVQDDTRELEQAEEALQEAKDDAARAEKKLAKAEKRVGKLDARSLQLQAEIDELRRKITEREHELESVDDDLGAAEEQRDDARGSTTEAAARLDKAQAVLTRLKDR